MFVRKAEQAEKERKEAKANEVCFFTHHAFILEGWKLMLGLVDSKETGSGVCYFD